MSSANFTAELGRNQFLQLFSTQLQHQDPMEPVGQQEFLQQLAQFSTVEGIENLNTGFSGLGTKLDSLIAISSSNNDLETLQALNAGTALLGKSVRYGEGANDVGTVAKIQPDNGQILVRIGNTMYPISSIAGVANSADAL
jgi:flagellar basal-body rod modification protein FlgD